MNPLPSQLPIRPITKPLNATLQIPGSKSITNRALLLAALCPKTITLRNALFSDDTRLMSAALRQLGLTIVENESAQTITLSNQSNIFPDTGSSTEPIKLHVGLAGTAARFLTALCAAAPRGIYQIDGTEKMRTRPMRGLIDSLRQLGADIRCLGTEGHLPIEIRARSLNGGPVSIDATESSQMLSALLMVAPLAKTPVRITTTAPVREPFVQMTLQMMRQFGQQLPTISDNNNPLGAAAPYSLVASRYSLVADTYTIEPDATSATYFLALPLITTGTLTFPSFPSENNSLQGDIRFLPILRTLGLQTTHANNTLTITAPKSLLQLNSIRTYSQQHPFIDQNFSNFSDTFLTLAALSPLLGGITRITGIAHTRKQESDRVAGASTQLRALGQHVLETEDTLEIHPRPLLPNIAIETYHDHRFAMSFAILGTHDLLGNSTPWLTIKNPACSHKTFPSFFDLLSSIQ